MARGITDHTLDRAHRLAASAVETTDASDDEKDARPRRPHELTEHIADEPIDPAAGRRLAADDPLVEEYLDEEDLDTGDSGRFYEGHFDDEASTIIAHYFPGDHLRFHHGDQLLASAPLDDFDDHLPDGDILYIETGPVDLVAGDGHQLMLVQRRTDDDGIQTYYLTIYKLIAERIGTIFSKPIAHRDDQQALVRTLDIRVLHGTDHRVIEAIPLDDDGQPAGDPQRYEWNPWEGVYRLPHAPPTAPDDPVAWLNPQSLTAAFSTTR